MEYPWCHGWNREYETGCPLVDNPENQENMRRILLVSYNEKSMANDVESTLNGTVFVVQREFQFRGR